MDILRHHYKPKQNSFIDIEYNKQRELPMVPALTEKDLTIQVEYSPKVIFQHTPSFAYYPEHSNIDTHHVL